MASEDQALLVPLALMVAYYDVRYRRIPNHLVLATLLIGLVVNAYFGAWSGVWLSLKEYKQQFSGGRVRVVRALSVEEALRLDSKLVPALTLKAKLAMAANRYDVARLVSAFPQSLTNRRHLHRQVRLFDNLVNPHSLVQLVLFDQSPLVFQ